jgi:hypothetical protein
MMGERDGRKPSGNEYAYALPRGNGSLLNHGILC